MEQQLMSKRAAWLIWLLITVFYAYQYILRVLPNILMPELMAKFHVNVEELGQFSGLYYIGYAGAHIPLGLLLDRKGLKQIIPVCIILTVLGLTPLMFSGNWIYPSLGRILIGVGSSAAALGAFKIIRLGFPAHHFARMLGLCVSIGLVAAIYGGQTIEFFIQKFGSRNVLKALAGIGAFLALGSFMLIPKQDALQIKISSVIEDIKSVFSNTTVLSICLFAGLMVGPLEGFADVWGAEFLRTFYHFDIATCKKIPSFIFLGMCFGTPLLTYFADKTQIYLRTIIVCAFGMCLAFIYLLSGLGNALSLYIVFSVIGVMCGYQIIAIYKASTFVPANLIGLTTACCNMIIMLFGYIFHSAIGFLIKSQWNGLMENNEPVYSFDALISSLSVIPESLLIAGYGFILISKGLKKSDVS